MVAAVRKAANLHGRQSVDCSSRLAGNGPAWVKQDGCKPLGLPTWWRSYHGKVETQEGQVGHRDLIVWVTRTDSHEDESLEDPKGVRSDFLGSERARLRLPPPRTEACASCRIKVKKACRRRRTVEASWEEETPEG